MASTSSVQVCHRKEAGLSHSSITLSLMTSNSNNSTDSPGCPSSGGTESRTSSSTNVSNNLVLNGDNQNASAVHSTPPLSSQSSSVCALTTPYDSRLISGYPRLGGLYGPSYSEQNSFYTSAANPFYSSFGTPYDLKDANSGGWSPVLPVPQSTCYLYDPIYSPYTERYGPMDGVARRKNVTRDSTTTLKAWLNEHRKNPYPTKGEKIMLAIITKMTLTQVSTWFANARRRLKKENKMTWEPRNRSEANDSDDEDFRETDDNSNIDNQFLNGSSKSSLNKDTNSVELDSTASSGQQMESTERDSANSYPTVKESVAEKSHSEHIPNGHESKPIVSHQINNSRPHLNPTLLHIKQDSAHNMLDGVTTIDTIGHRPKIWSLAETATSGSPPFGGKVAPINPEDWASTLPGGPEGAIALSYYQRDCPQGSRLATHFRNDHCNPRSAMHLLTSETIGSHNYIHNIHASKSVTVSSFSGISHHPHLQLPTPMTHLMSPNADLLNSSHNPIRPMIDSQSCNTLSDINDNRLTNETTSKSNSFLCKVFPDYISSGPDALSFNDKRSPSV